MPASFDKDLATYHFALTRAYHRLTAVSDRLHGASGISTGTRSLLLLLDLHGPLTLSEIARDRAVSRQFIQRVAAPLLEARWVVLASNLQNRRSPKLALTKSGRSTVEAILGREAALLGAIAATVSVGDLAVAVRVMGLIDQCLDRASAETGA